MKATNSAYSFTETSITAEPGETVQVCVDKQAGGFDSSNSLGVQVVGNKDPHLSSFSGTSLSFPFGLNQACFDLVIGSDEVNETYQLGISGTAEVLGIVVESAAKPGLCGAAPAIGNVSEEEAVAMDRFGNLYSPR